jgi:hypothetical protein
VEEAFDQSYFNNLEYIKSFNLSMGNQPFDKEELQDFGE